MFSGEEGEILIFALLPQRNRGEIAIKNDKFKEGKEMWGYRWLEMTYPARDSENQRVYKFKFDNQKRVLTVTCQGQVRELSCFTT